MKKIVTLLKTQYIKNLEKRCKKANFAPFDLRIPMNNKWIWDKHTIWNAEIWLINLKFKKKLL